MRAILVGAGGVSRDLLRRLGEMWEVTIVDLSRERLSLAAQSRTASIVEGDGSSRVVLRRAGIDRADAVVAATDDDEVNLEVCRLSREFDVSRIVAVSRDPERTADYSRLGVTSISPQTLAARRVELNLEPRRVSSMAFAHGRAEAIEFRVEADSPVRGKSLADLRAHSFVVGAILRGDELVVPHGDTVLEAGDLVTVVGAGADFAEIVRTFTSGQARFPLDFGKRVAVALDGRADLNGSFMEAVHLVRTSEATSVLLVHRDPDSIREDSRSDQMRGLVDEAPRLADGVEIRTRAVETRPSRALFRLPREESVGAIVMRAPRIKGALGWSKIARALSLLRRTHRPVLISRGCAPYRRIVVPARRTSAGRAAMRTAIELARQGKAELKGVAVVDPIFLSGPGAPHEARESISWLEEEAAAHGIEAEGLIRRGNPVRTLIHLGDDAGLVVLGVDPHVRTPLRGLGIGGLVARGTAASVLLVPA
jgi:Trk K+ transport system NAD-binding subunit/nucleotide-binding universal stress UspA family protein